jgi:ATP-binding cassette subfamily F protein 3
VHFPGAVVVVSHDRFFSEKIANRHLVFGAEGAGPGEIAVRVA